MIQSRVFMIPVIAVLAICSLSHADEKATIFHDDFNRGDADAVGNEWFTRGAALLKDNAALFKSKEEEFRPRMRHSFPLQDKGKFTVSFLMDWLRTSEGTWGFYMQLGHSETMRKHLVYERDLARGVGVNLIWGGGELVNFQARGSLGHLNGGQFKPLVVVNDAKVKSSVVEKAVVTIDVDVDAGTYSVKLNGKTYPDIPFDNNGPIDTIRFISNGCSASGFSKSSIDDVIVSK